MQHESNINFVQAILADAMRERRLISGTYNSSTLSLAPHQVILRNGAFYLGAVNPNKNRRSDEAPGLGYFKLDGLSDIALSDERFEPLPAEACAPAREGDMVIAGLD